MSYGNCFLGPPKERPRSGPSALDELRAQRRELVRRLASVDAELRAYDRPGAEL